MLILELVQANFTVVMGYLRPQKQRFLLFFVVQHIWDHSLAAECKPSKV